MVPKQDAAKLLNCKEDSSRGAGRTRSLCPIAGAGRQDLLDWRTIQSYALNKRMIDKVDTKSRILDTAEKLFGMNGFDGTSLRDITTAADVNLAAINYHFQTKDSLIDAIVARRIEPVNKKRFEL